MEILGFGPLEILLIIVIALVVMGPEDMLKNARKLGQSIRRFIRSDFWQELIGTTQDIRNLPKELIKDTGLEDDLKEIKQSTREISTQINSEMRLTEKEVVDEVKEASRQTELEMAAASREVSSGMRGAPGALPPSEPPAPAAEPAPAETPAPPPEEPASFDI